ncbi:MAG: hypothetical protein CR975_03215 [Gammaproteobacteria bacterium]|nr:MAG: hypothetical protein CR975_03215 [Gammaproteobacteria bacterium]
MSYIACLHCDLLIKTRSLSLGEHADCPRCHQVLYHDKRNLSSSLALLIAALIIYFPAILLPFLNMQASGQEQEISLFSSLAEIAAGSSLYLAITVFVLVLFLPLLKFLGLLLIIIPLSRQRRPLLGVTVIRYILNLASWSMVEVYLIGVIVTLVKLTGIADIYFLNGFYAFALLIIVDALISLTLPKKRIWQGVSILNQQPYGKEQVRNER